MKKIAIALMLCMVSIMSFAQITISNGGSSKTSDYIMKDPYFNIRQIDTMFFLNIKDVESTEFIRISLGATPSEAYQSLTTLCDWFKSAKTKDYIEFETNGQMVTMYKYASSVPYFSDGDVEYIKRYIEKSMMQGFFGTPNRKRENDKMVGWITSIGQLKKACTKLQELQ
jgi:hypothetical protein